MADTLLLETGTDKLLLEDSSFLLLAYSAYEVAVMADSPVSYWRLGEASGTVAVDSRGTTPGTYVDNGVGAITYGVIGALITDPDTAISLTSSSHWITVFGVAPLFVGTASWTMEVWVNRVTENVAFPRLFSARNASGTSTVHLSANDTYLIANVDGTDLIVVSPTPVIAGTTHHVVLTYDGAALRLYADGTLVGGPTAATIGTTAKTEATIGGEGGAGIVATLDEIAVYNTVLSASQVRAHYDAFPQRMLYLSPMPQLLPQ